MDFPRPVATDDGVPFIEGLGCKRAIEITSDVRKLMNGIIHGPPSQINRISDLWSTPVDLQANIPVWMDCANENLLHTFGWLGEQTWPRRS